MLAVVYLQLQYPHDPPLLKLLVHPYAGWGRGQDSADSVGSGFIARVKRNFGAVMRDLHGHDTWFVCNCVLLADIGG